MSMLNDKILKGGEITTTGKQNGLGVKAFYLMLVPKTDDASAIAVLNVKLSQEKDYKDFPFPIGQWNPVVLNDVNVKSEDLTNYRIFYGSEI